MDTVLFCHHILAGLKFLYAFSSVYHCCCKDSNFLRNFQILKQRMQIFFIRLRFAGVLFHLPIIVVLRNGFTPLSKPKGEQFDACAQGRLLMLSAWAHQNERITLTAFDCQQMNLMALELSQL